MEDVQRFEIILDVSDRELLYDYVECQEYAKPENGEWDFSIFKGKGSLDCVHEDDENGQLRVELIDKAISDKRVLEKKSQSRKDVDKHQIDVEETLASFDSDVNQLPRRIIPIYRAEETVRGKVLLKLNAPVQAEKLVVGLQGQALVSIRIYHPKGFFDSISEEKFVREKVALWKSTECKDKGVEDTFSLLSTDDSIPMSSVLTAGSHTFDFAFTIPPAVAQSAPPMVISTINKGYIMYRIKAAIDKGKTLASGNIVTHKGLWLKKDFDIGKEPKKLEPITVEETLDTGVITFWKSGKITVRATLPKVAFLIGEDVPVTIEIYNESKGDINIVSACVRMYGKARLSDAKLAVSQGIDIKSTKIREGPVSSGACPVYKMIIPWKFNDSSADGNLLPVGDLDDCKLLDIKYEVYLKLKRKGLHRNMQFSVPIVIGNVNSKRPE